MRVEPPVREFDEARAIALSLPAVEEGLSYGTPGFRVKGKLFMRLREDGETLVVAVDMNVREALLAEEPDALYLTDHYRGYPWILVRLPVARPELLRERIEEAWRLQAPATLVRKYDQQGDSA